jgi:hypothetical protein
MYSFIPVEITAGVVQVLICFAATVAAVWNLMFAGRA